MIKFFKDEYDFLSTKYMIPIYIDNFLYESLEHYYQVMKVIWSFDHEDIRKTFSPWGYKKLGLDNHIKRDWNKYKLSIMFRGIFFKFQQSDRLLNNLLLTGNLKLVNGNSVNDTYWGKVNGFGENYLGRLLMQFRKNVRMNKLYLNNNNSL